MVYEDISAILDMAKSQLQQGNYDETERLANSILSILPSDEEICYELSAKRLLGVIAGLRGHHTQAVELLNTALTLATRLDDHSSSAIILSNLGNVHKELGNYDTSLDYYQQALYLHEQLGETSGVARVTGNMGNVYLNLGNYATCLEYFNRALAVHEALGNKPSAAIVTGNMGVAYLNLGNYTKSLECYTRALATHEELNEQSGVARAMGNIGIVYIEIGDNAKALEYYSRALAVHEQLGEKSAIARVTGNMGIVHKSLGDYSKALEYYHRALATHEEIGEKSGIALVTSNIGGVFHLLGTSAKALEYYRLALAIHEELGEQSGVAIALGNIGNVYADEGEEHTIIKAEEYLLQAIAMTEKLGMQTELLQNHKALAHLYEKQNRWEESVRHYKLHHELYIAVQNEEVKKQADKYGWERKILEIEKEREIEHLKAEAKKEKLEQKIEFQTQEVNRTIRELVAKNSFLQNVRLEVKKLDKFTKGEGIDILEKLTEKLTRNIASLESKTDLEQQWLEVHEPFMNQLKTLLPGLTTMELKIAALLKMKLTSSNISTILFLSKRTVEFHRLALRKKMNLSKTDDIYEHLSRILPSVDA